MDIERRIAEELSVREDQVRTTVELLDGGSTVPFIARYRKEATGGLDDAQLRRLEERLRYLRELDQRRETVLASIRDQGKLTPELEERIRGADTKTRLEDLYLPYKPRRRTKAQKAREAGLEPLAERLLGDPAREPRIEAGTFVDASRGVPDLDAALDGARSILVERFAEDAEAAGALREWMRTEGRLVARVVPGRERDGAKFRDWFDFSEPLGSVPSHRALALLRGKHEGVLRLSIEAGTETDARPSGEVPGAEAPSEAGEGRLAARLGIVDRGRPADRFLLESVRAAWRLRLRPRLESDLLVRLREGAEEEAIRVFAQNLRDLLLAAPGGPRTTMGLDPGLRTGVKVAVVDGTGKLVAWTTVFPHAPRKRWDESVERLAALAREHSVEQIAIGNGTASRETDRLVRELVARHSDLSLRHLVVSEAGASVYSASELAEREFPGLDVSYRGAASIARRLQDPLAELVKIEPRSIGVGQYQHDVHQGRLQRTLDAVVEDCVNAVGVDVNTASAPLLARVAGLSPALAESIVQHRDSHGPFPARDRLRDVPRLGPKSWEQAAGFLRIRGGENPLDASAVHPEAYPVVNRIIERSGRPVDRLIGDREFLRSLPPEELTDTTFGVPTVTDILAELEKPGRDPRPEFVAAEFREGVETLEDLAPGMVLEGTVTNVTGFGAFVDVGVHQEGLVHVSRLAEHWVRDPREVVKAGDVVRVKVLDVDLERRRIALSLRLGEEPGAPGGRKQGDASPRKARRSDRSGAGKSRSKRGSGTSPGDGGRRSGRTGKRGSPGKEKRSRSRERGTSPGKGSGRGASGGGGLSLGVVLDRALDDARRREAEEGTTESPPPGHDSPG